MTPTDPQVRPPRLGDGAIRQVVGLERRYRCRACAAQHRSWSRLRACPSCGTALTHAVIRRAAVA
jgi:hypothetical protein